MPAPYTNWNYKGRDPVALAAKKLLATRQIPSALSPYIFMTDPQRVPDPVDATLKLPRGATLIYRHFGRDNHEQTAQELRQISFKRDLQFLIGHDPKLAIKVGADGVHFRRDAYLSEPALWRQRCPGWIISMASLKGEQTYQGDLSVLDGLFLSSVFYSKSPSAGDPVGVARLNETCKALPIPVFALGGVKPRTAPDLIGSGAAGLAGVDGLLR